MAIIGNKFLDLVDLYKRQDGNGGIHHVIEMLTKMNPVMEDALAVECNMGHKHRTTVRGGLPSVTWGRFYKGIPNSKSKIVQVDDTTGFVEALSTVDERLLKVSDNEAAVRLSEASSFLESMSQEVETKFFYANDSVDPDQFLGLAPRFNDLSAASGAQVVDAGGTGADNMSIWFVIWGENQTHLLYPKGTMAGITREDKGSQRVLDPDGNAYYAKEELFTQHIGLTVRDFRYVSRIANIDVSELKAGNVQLYDFMRAAYYRLWHRRNKVGKPCIYMNRDALEALDALATNRGANDSFVRLTRKEIEGEEVMTYRSMVIRETDSLINSEARVV